MQTYFTAQPLTADRVALAFPLISAIAANLSQEAWCDLAAKLAGGRPEDGGVIAVEGNSGYIHGVFAYRVVTDLGLAGADRGRTLHVDNLAIADLLRRDEVINALIGAIESLANKYQCAAKQVNLSAATQLPEAARARLLAPLTPVNF